ncbi:hypothetical protein BDV23DRAFT_154108 [Aspergillus alliaceus]|uniref:Uncharacterized protein n=1 Tax=Petromyces alliaceus TaxID=209559 RepID=A0A5N6G3R7_PETAA|nr:uncharacterized protein BDW43DRAFT_308017 [Aspergillus alliaceus]KAB8237006.1 hypothetical protein BDW43DRAFT_308017 [Aspergillus alliaceus]KAE8390904.1 hypothetical protein BDV23DRAFT_154108 [Aspergillus alliaceus]
MPSPSLTTGKGGSLAARSRRTAILSIFAIIGGSWLAFRALSPRRSQAYVSEGDHRAQNDEVILGRSKFVSEADRETMKGGGTGENKTGRAPRKGLTTP